MMIDGPQQGEGDGVVWAMASSMLSRNDIIGVRGVNSPYLLSDF